MNGSVESLRSKRLMKTFILPMRGDSRYDLHSILVYIPMYYGKVHDLAFGSAL